MTRLEMMLWLLIRLRITDGVGYHRQGGIRINISEDKRVGERWIALSSVMVS